MQTMHDAACGGSTGPSGSLTAASDHLFTPLKHSPFLPLCHSLLRPRSLSSLLWDSLFESPLHLVPFLSLSGLSKHNRLICSDRAWTEPPKGCGTQHSPTLFFLLCRSLRNNLPSLSVVTPFNNLKLYNRISLYYLGKKKKIETEKGARC